MPNAINYSKLMMFADDSKCYKTVGKISDSVALQEYLNPLTSLSKKNELYFLSSKCHNLRVSRKRCRLNCTYNNIDQTDIDNVSEKDLRGTVTSDLTWNKHIKTILAKANKMLAFLKRNCAKDLKEDTFKLLYMSLVRSNLSYCSNVWAPQWSISQLILMERILRRDTHATLIQKNV